MAVAAVSIGAENKPNFSGVWKLLDGEHPPEIIIIDQNQIELRVVQFIEDRPGVVKGPIDGQPHSQVVNGSPCDFLARWEGDSLFFETKRDPVTYVQHLMSLAANGKTMTVMHPNVTPQPGTVREKWEKQDPAPWETFISGFDFRSQLDDRASGLSGAEGSRLRGLVANDFNDLPQAEREFLTIVDQQPKSKFRDEARRNLAILYERNRLTRNALPYCSPRDRAICKQLARYPEMSVTHRGDAHIQVTRDPDGRIVLPVSFVGKDSRLMVDTGTATSLLRMSEVDRLGLKLEPLHRSVGNGNVAYDGILPIVPVLTVGASRFENVPFLVVPDARLEWPGIIGIDLLLKLETLRWNASGDGEIGFPAQEKNIRNANLCFADYFVLADLSFNGQGSMILLLDTGNNATYFFPPFAARNLDLVAANGKQSVEPWHAQGTRGEVRTMVFPEITLRIGGADQTLRPAEVMLERPPVNDKLQGTIGMDLLNLAQRVTLDFRAMRLTLE